MSAVPVPHDTPGMSADDWARSAAIRQLAAASSLASRLGGCLDALKISIDRGDARMAAIQVQQVDLLIERLDEKLDSNQLNAALDRARPSGEGLPF